MSKDFCYLTLNNKLSLMRYILDSELDYLFSKGSYYILKNIPIHDFFKDTFKAVNYIVRNENNSSIFSSFKVEGYTYIYYHKYRDFLNGYLELGEFDGRGNFKAFISLEDSLDIENSKDSASDIIYLSDLSNN